MRTRNNQCALLFLIAVFVGHAGSVKADTEEVSFQLPTGTLEVVPGSAIPGGPVPIAMSGNFFFSSTDFTGGLRPVFQVPGSPPGAPGSAEVFFAAGPSGTLTVDYSDGSVLTTPLESGFSLYADFEAPVCGNFDDCFYTVGHVLTLNQFNASPDPWALILSGMNGGFGEFFPSLEIDSLFPGSGQWTIQGSGKFEVSSVPEPSVLSLFALGLGLTAFVRIGRRRLANRARSRVPTLN